MEQLRNMPFAESSLTCQAQSKNFLQEKEVWSEASLIAIANLRAEKLALLIQAAEPTAHIDIDTPDNSDLRSNDAPTGAVAVRTPRIQVDETGTPMMYDTKTDTWFPITVVLPGQNQPTPAAPSIPEAEKRKQLIGIFAISLLVLLVILYFNSRKK